MNKSKDGELLLELDFQIYDISRRWLYYIR